MVIRKHSQLAAVIANPPPHQEGPHVGGEAWGELRANEWESKGSVSVQSEGKLFFKR